MHKLLLLPLIIALSSCSGKSNIENDPHKMCLQAKDYSGCLKSMTENSDQGSELNQKDERLIEKDDPIIEKVEESEVIIKEKVENDPHKMCLLAKDYSGCLKSMTGNSDQISEPKEEKEVPVDLEFEGKLLGEYLCKDRKFKITNSSAQKPFTSFEFDKWYGENEFVEQFRLAGSTAADAQSAFLYVQGLRVSTCSNK